MVVPQVLSERRSPVPSRGRDLLALLPADERDAIVLAGVERFNYRDVAVALGITEESAKRRIRSGLQRLRVETLQLARTAG